MILFLTLIYVAILFAAVKIGIVKMNTFWKLSPLLWAVLLFMVLFVPMQWGAPSGATRVYKAVIEIVPNVTGEVAEILVEPMVPVKQGDVLFSINPIQFQARVAQLEAQLLLSRANLERAEEIMAKGVGRQVDVDIYVAEVASTVALLADARWQLDETRVKAPSDGKVVALALRAGQRVSNLPMRSWIAFVEKDTAQLVVGIPQSRLRHVEPGQKADVVLRLYPGETFSATVSRIININSAAQLQASGLIPAAPSLADPTLPYGVVLDLDNPSIDLSAIPGGATGTAAIYTDSVAATHIIRKVMMRMEAWMNYLNP